MSSELKGRIIEANDKINKLQTNIDERHFQKANNEISRGQEENVREFRELKKEFDKSRKLINFKPNYLGWYFIWRVNSLTLFQNFDRNFI